MTFMRRPRVFLSYRHEERQGDSLAAGYSASHRAWVNDFAHALASWNVDVVWDDRLRELFGFPNPVDPALIPFLAEISTLCLHVAQTFVPILTRGYVERVSGAGGGAGYGTVTEEWLQGKAESQASRLEMVAIVREWPIPEYATPPPPITPENAWDFRFVQANRDEVELLSDLLHGLWSVERPSFDRSFRDWISSYLKFSEAEFGFRWSRIKTWGCNFERPRIFLEFSANVAAMNSQIKAAGSDRDMEEFLKMLGPRMSTYPEGVEQPARLSPAEEEEATEKAKQLARSVFAAHAETYRKPFAFSESAPGGRASNGLYFGPTLQDFSFLHPLDPRRHELPR